MSFRQRHGTIGRRLWPLGVLAVLLPAQALVPSGALGASPVARGGGSATRARAAVQGTPTQVIDAQADPQAAAAAIDSGCTDLSNCSWNGSTVTFSYGPSQIYGDVLYNCSDPATEPDAMANTAAGFTETRSESVSLSESVSVKISLGFLGFEKASAEFKATFGQSSSFSQSVTTTTTVPVPPGYKGWIESQVLSGDVTGDAYITDGINLIQVKNLGMSFPLSDPAHQDPGDARAPAIYNTFSQPMTPADYSTHCGPINGLGAVRSQALPHTFKVTFCDTVSGASGCATREVAGAAAPPPAEVRATAVLERDGRKYATGTDNNREIRLNTHRPIEAGNYTLTIHERRPGHDDRRRTLTTFTTVIPVAIRGMTAAAGGPGSPGVLSGNIVQTPSTSRKTPAATRST